MTPRGPRKLAEPEAFKITVECGRFDIVVEERSGQPGYVMMRRWKPAAPGRKGMWERKAIGRMELRDAQGAVLASATATAKDAAMKWYLTLTGEIATAPVEAESAPFTIDDAWKAVSNEETGKYPHKGPMRDDVQRSLAYAVTVWGKATPWTAIDTDAWTKLMRRRVRELVAQGNTGIRTTEITVSRIMTVVRWLRLKKRIPANAAEPDPTWRDDLITYWKGLTKQAHDPEPFRPRYTEEEARKLILAASDVDPRCGLLVALGAELRLGQVRRAKRTDLALSKSEYGEFTVRGSGDKRGEVIELTRGQRVAVDRALRGYLSLLEERFQETGADYYLFAGGKLSGRVAGSPVITGADPDSLQPLSRTALSRRWPLIEFLVGITHIEGRGAYGVRRHSVDAALGANISEHGLKSLGGWGSTDVPRRIYAEQENRVGRADAKKVRAKIRGEAE